MVATKPKADRYFPLEVVEFCTLTARWPLAGREPRTFVNPEGLGPGVHPLAELRPGRSVSLYSLPEAIVPTIGRRAATLALEWLASRTGEPVSGRDTARHILASLVGECRLRITKETATLHCPSFGRGEGLATSSKPRVGRRRAVELAVLELD